MAERIVINTGPLLAFGKMQAFEVIRELPFDFVCPAEVETEILAGARKGYDVEIPDWIKVLPLNSAISPLAIASLDIGEAAVIQLALEQEIETVCIDESKGRRAALSVGLRIVGSFGLLGRAKTRGSITKIKPFIDRAKSGGIFYDDTLVETFLKSFGE